MQAGLGGSSSSITDLLTLVDVRQHRMRGKKKNNRADSVPRGINRGTVTKPGHKLLIKLLFGMCFYVCKSALLFWVLLVILVTSATQISISFFFFKLLLVLWLFTCSLLLLWLSEFYVFSLSSIGAIM